jgi:hypothetical protein
VKPPNKTDLIGKRFHHLTAVRWDHGYYWLCQCACGGTRVVNRWDLRKGNVKSCGCRTGRPPIGLVAIGMRFGLLVVEKHIHGAQWQCRCQCGAEKIAQRGMLLNGQVKSCGCAMGSRTGRSYSWRTKAESDIWKQMIRRCTQPKTKHYHRYGGRGITVCDRWQASFETFYLDMGPRPSPQHSLDRINNDANYEPTNCRWATRDVQSQNRSDVQRITFGGHTRTWMEWSEHLGVASNTLSRRRKLGWPLEDVLSTPFGVRRAATAGKTKVPVMQRQDASPGYWAWAGMKQKCSKPTNVNYALYGGRGIKVCDRWSDFSAFQKDMGPRPSPKHVLDRTNKDGDFEPTNCVWITVDRHYNNKEAVPRITFRVQTKTLRDWANDLGISYRVLRKRYKRKWPVEDLLTTPPGAHSAAAITASGPMTRKRAQKTHPEYSVWTSMKSRCGNPNDKSYARYGGRGIRVCERWIESFDNFRADIGPRPSMQHSLDRKDNNGDYEPGNCRWATYTQQGSNKRNTVWLTFGGDTKTMSEWATILGVKYSTIKMRYHKGWPVERVLASSQALREARTLRPQNRRTRAHKAPPTD